MKDGTACAVWVTSPERGEKVEFLVPHEGMQQTLNERISVHGQRSQFLFHRAVMNLHNALHPREHAWIRRAAAMRVEREPALTYSAAEADLRGRLTDLLDVLRPFDTLWT